MRNFLNEFKEFAIRGNVVDMAIGIIIGGAFGKIVTSLVEDILMPPLSIILGEVDFSSKFISLNGEDYQTLAAAKAAGAPTINYGMFLNSCITFLIIGFAAFLLVKQVNRLRRKEDTSSITPTQKSCEFCKMSISIKALRCPFCTSKISEKTQRQTN